MMEFMLVLKGTWDVEGANDEKHIDTISVGLCTVYSYSYSYSYSFFVSTEAINGSNYTPEAL